MIGASEAITAPGETGSTELLSLLRADPAFFFWQMLKMSPVAIAAGLALAVVSPWLMQQSIAWSLAAVVVILLLIPKTWPSQIEWHGPEAKTLHGAIIDWLPRHYYLKRDTASGWEVWARVRRGWRRRLPRMPVYVRYDNNTLTIRAPRALVRTLRARFHGHAH